MSILGVLLFFLARLLDVLLFAVFARVILSWIVGHDFHSSRIYQFLHDVTEPLFHVAKLLPHRIGMMDISAIYVFILLDILSAVVSYLSASIFY